MMSRLINYWVYGGFLAGLVLLAITPVLAGEWSTALTVVFLQLPIYMLHQYEEHDDDRFRQFVNRTIGGGREVLSPGAVFVINVPGVWGVNALAFILAANVAIGLGLVALYLTLVNGVIHVAGSLATRAYNPGLWTAVVLFLPVGGFGVYELQRTGEVGWVYHLIGLASALGIHAAIVVYVQMMKRNAPNL